MEDSTILAISVVALMVAAGAAWVFFTGPQSPMAAGWKRRLNELDVATRMGKPEEIIEALRETAKLYIRLGKKWEAETVLRRAMLMSKQQFGEMNEGLIPLMDDFANLMDKVGRPREGEKMRKEIQRIKQRKN